MAATNKVQETAAADLELLLDAEEGAVVTLEAGETSLVVHKAVLAARSPVFEAMFQHNMLEASSGRVSIPDVEGQVLRKLLVYMYTVQVPQLAAMVLQMLVAADKYGLLGLRAHCEQQIASQLSVETAAAAAVVAVRHSCSGLRQAAIAFIRANLEVMATEEWANAVRSQPEHAIEVMRLLAETTPEISAAAQCHCQSQFYPTLWLTSAAAALPTPACQTPIHAGDAVSGLWSLTSEEKARRLIMASEDGRVEEVEALLAAGADVHARNRFWWTALHYAAVGGHVEVARRLVWFGAEVDARNTWQQLTSLHWAAMRGHTAVVALLAAYYGDVDARSVYEDTPLHEAARNGNREAAAMLLRAGANREARNYMGKTPLDFAREYNKQNVIEVLT